MKKTFLILFSFLMFACESNSTNEEIVPPNKEIPLTKLESIIKLYNESVFPLFKNYKNVVVPTDFKVDKDDLSINAGASFGHVEVSQGLVNVTKEHIQLFALSHEVAHIVTISQARTFGLQGSIPKGIITNDYKKAEYLADLIAIHLIKTELNKAYHLLSADFVFLENLLGGSTFTHPSGKERINEIQTYLKDIILTDNEDAFRTNFIRIWQME